MITLRRTPKLSSNIVTSNTDFGHEIADAVGIFYNEVSDQNIAVTRQGNLAGGVVYQGYTGTSIQLHMAGFVPKWATREFLFTAFDYPFRQLGCKVVLGQVEVDNTTALEIDLRLGFKEVARIEDAYPTGAAVIVAMRKEDCRWLNHKPRGIPSQTEG